jgi:cardiolipin synthase
VLNLPNFLTVLRILAIPVFLILLTDGNVGAALIVFLLAGVTDSLDGAIARLTDSRTTLGAYLDPLADKMLILSTFVVLAFMEAVPHWLTVVVLTRDVIILVGYLTLFLLTQRLMEIRPSMLSKISTFCSILTLCAVLLWLWRPNMLSPRSLFALFVVTGAFATASGVQYIVRGLTWYQNIASQPGAGQGGAGER